MEDGGWNPMLRRRRVANQYSRSVDNGVVTIFVDDIPNSMTPKGLYTLFNKFGVVKDAFIPSKRRKVTGSRFGFVRYECKVAAEMAVLKADGLWCDNKALKVKKAEFKKGEFKQCIMTNRGEDPMMQRPQRSFGHKRMEGSGRRSFAEVVQSGGSNEKMKVIVKAFEVGNGWLYDSVIVKLKSFFSFDEFKKEVGKRGMEEVRVREGGGRVALLTFKSQEHKREARTKLQEWMLEWCDSITDWEKGKYVEQKRCVWLACAGVPFNLWSVNTFRDIGKLWGEVVQFDDDTTNQNSLQWGKVRVITSKMEFINTVIHVECNGSLFPVRVCEEIPAAGKPCHCNSSYMDNEVTGPMAQDEVDQLSKNGEADKEEHEDEHKRKEDRSRKDEQDMVDCDTGKKDEGNECLSVSAVKETEDGMGNQKVRGDSLEGRLVNSATPRNEIQIVEGHVCTPGFIRSLSGPESLRPKLNLEVVLDGLQDEEHRPITDFSNLSDCVAQTQLRPLVQQEAELRVTVKDNPVRKGKPTQAVVNRCDQVGGNLRNRSKATKNQNKQKEVMRSNCFKQGAIFRAAAAAISMSVEQSLNTKRRNKLLTEAQATMEVGKILGLNFEGKENEVMGKLAELEEKDMERAEGEAVAP
ncbi:hypothetical protein ACSBR1_040775 [Camellia fascicularis]